MLKVPKKKKLGKAATFQPDALPPLDANLGSEPIPEEDSEDISADEAERDRKGKNPKNLLHAQSEDGLLTRTTTLMKKKTIITRQVTTVDDITGEIIDQKTEQVVKTESDDELTDEIGNDAVDLVNKEEKIDGIMTMHDNRTDKTYKVAIVNN